MTSIVKPDRSLPVRTDGLETRPWIDPVYLRGQRQWAKDTLIVWGLIASSSAMLFYLAFAGGAGV